MVLQKYQRFTYQRHIFKITSVTPPSPAPCNGGNSSLLTPGSNSGATLHRRDRDSVVCLIQLKSSWGYEDLNLSQGKNLGKMLSLPLETGRRMGEGRGVSSTCRQLHRNARNQLLPLAVRSRTGEPETGRFKETREGDPPHPFLTED